MKQKIHFPKIRVFETEEGFEGMAALKLKSILKADLLLNQYGSLQEKVPHLNRLNPKVQHQARESFLHALSSLPRSLTLELHMTTPCLGQPLTWPGFDRSLSLGCCVH